MTLVSYLLSVLYPAIGVLTTICAWTVPVLMWQSLGRSALQQVLVLLAIGVMTLSFAYGKGYFPGWTQVLSTNLPLLAMFVAVAFLTLTNKSVEDSELPGGKPAVVTTAIGTHILGAVINLSVIFVFGDRIQRKGRLTQEQQIILARSFSAAAWWSPFFIATGVVLTYAPEMIWRKTMVPGVLMSLLALTYSIVEVCYIRKNKFSGYPLRFDSLMVPLFLAGSVVSIHQLFPDVSILLVICMISPVGALLFMRGRPRKQVLGNFIQVRILSVVSQFALFLAAGVFSTGIKSILHVYPGVLSFEGMQFSPIMFSLVLAVMLVVGMFGVHPLVSVAVVSPLILPLTPDHSQLAFMFLCSWAISTGSSPFSGIGLAMISRYHASPRQIIQSNYHYVIMMWLIASGLNILCLS
ncbi:hypothetical protein [Desulforhopalus sp. 52FAK]